MYVQKIENTNNDICYNQKHTNSSFKGTVSPEFVKYVNEIREDCLQTVPKRSANFINNVCDSILEKSNEIMKKWFPPTSVLSVDTKTYPHNCTVGVDDGILKKYGATLTHSGFIYEHFSPLKKLNWLRFLIKDKKLNVFAEANGKQLQGISGLEYILSKYNDYNKYNEGFSDLEYLLKWWDEHMDFFMLDFELYKTRKNFISKAMSDLKERKQELMQNEN